MFIRSRTLINDLFSDSDKYLNTDICVCGWIETMRVQGAQTFGFLSLNDGSCLNSLQVIVNIENDEMKNEFDGIFGRGTNTFTCSHTMEVALLWPIQGLPRA